MAQEIKSLNDFLSSAEVAATPTDSPFVKNLIQKSIYETEEINNPKHGLDEEELNILFNILAKKLPNCGRERGAIIRYINRHKKPKMERTPAMLESFLKTR